MDGKQLIIVLDESTSQKNDNSEHELGKSLCFWVAYVYDPDDDNHPTNQSIPREKRYESAILLKSINAKPVRSGAIYNDNDTPIKICLDGAARALESCDYLVYKHKIKEVILIGDCDPAIKFINKEKNINAGSVKSLCDRIDEFKNNYIKKGATISAKYVSEEDFPLFKDIDGITKEFRGKIDKTLNQ